MAKCDVAVGIIANKQNQIFITHRQPGKELSDYWEFPGGKVEENEPVIEALKRELNEELGIDVVAANHFTTFDYAYPNKTVTLHFYLIDEYRGEPFGKEGQKAQWVALDDIQHFAFPDANKAIVAMLQENAS